MRLNLPNWLTVARVFMIPLFLAALFGGFFADQSTARLTAALIFIVASATDVLDGYIARRYNMITTFGKFADPLADKLLVSAALIAMVELGDISAWIAVLIISREFVITGFRLVAAGRAVVIAAGFWGKLKTIAQMLMIPVVLSNYDYQPARAVGAFLIYLSVCLTIISMIDYIYKYSYVLKEAD
jgi:CDP-diacylglycerol--glycerol-3-phosphate 3-phosphatidyltransferase